jgi:integrase
MNKTDSDLSGTAVLSGRRIRHLERHCNIDAGNRYAAGGGLPDSEDECAVGILAPRLHPFGKTKAAPRRVPLSAAAIVILKARLESAKGEYLFRHRKDANRSPHKNPHTRGFRH